MSIFFLFQLLVNMFVRLHTPYHKPDSQGRQRHLTVAVHLRFVLLCSSSQIQGLSSVYRR